MHQTNCPGISVDQVNRAAISYVNPKADIALIGNQPIATFETVISGGNGIDPCDLVSMNLAHRNKLSIAQTKKLPRSEEHTSELFQNNRCDVRQFQHGNAA